MLFRTAMAAVILAGLATPLRAADGPTPFDAELLRLSEILGAVTYLDGLCGSSGSQAWRAAMQDLIEAQRMTPEDRRRYVDVFNRGHRTFASVHRVCTDRTRFVLDRYFAEGAAIATRIEDRFGRGPSAPAPANSPTGTAELPAR